MARARHLIGFALGLGAVLLGACAVTAAWWHAPRVLAWLDASTTLDAVIAWVALAYALTAMRRYRVSRPDAEELEQEAVTRAIVACSSDTMPGHWRHQA